MLELIIKRHGGSTKMNSFSKNAKLYALDIDLTKTGKIKSFYFNSRKHRDMAAEEVNKEEKVNKFMDVF